MGQGFREFARNTKKPLNRKIDRDGSAHAQFLFSTGQAGRLMREILNFLSEP